jgi:hypothetical protein
MSETTETRETSAGTGPALPDRGDHGASAQIQHAGGKSTSAAASHVATSSAGSGPELQAPPGPSTPAVVESPLKSSLSVLTTLGPPVTVASALMLYYGWARTDQQAHAMGLDVSLFGYTTQDYVLRSVGTLYLPLLVLGVLALGWLTAHQSVDRRLQRPGPHRRVRLAGWIILGLGLSIALGTLAVAVSRNRPPLLFPLAVGAGVTAAAYGGSLVRAAGGTGRDAAPPWQRALRTLLVSGVVALALFWQLSDFAGVIGRGYADEVEASVPALPRATAYSPVPLGIQAPGVVEEPIDVDPSAADAPEAARYRITGLRLLTESGGRMFLLHDGWTAETGTVVVLPVDDRVRWEFSR